MPMALGKDPENCKKKLHSIVTDNIYIYIYIYIYINHHIYITNMHYISQAHAYLINPSQMHQSSTSQVYYYKFNISTAVTETASVAPWTAVKDQTAAKG